MEEGLQAIVGLVVIVIGFGAAVAYPKLQYNAIKQLHGVWRALSMLPLLVMAVVIAVTVPALVEGGNLWPLLIIFVTPFATLYLVGLLFADSYLARRRGLSDPAPKGTL